MKRSCGRKDTIMSKPKSSKPNKSAAAKPKAAPKKSNSSGNGKPPEEMSAPMQAGLAAVEAMPPAPPKESKLSLVIKLLTRTEGATIDDMTAATSWQKHTVRAALSHALAKKRGYKIVSEKSQGGKRTYKIAEPAKDDH
jgi:hypothetical protein